MYIRCSNLLQAGGLRIFAKCDDFMRHVMAELDIPVEEFQGQGDDTIAQYVSSSRFTIFTHLLIRTVLFPQGNGQLDLRS